MLEIECDLLSRISADRVRTLLNLINLRRFIRTSHIRRFSTHCFLFYWNFGHLVLKKPVLRVDHKDAHKNGQNILHQSRVLLFRVDLQTFNGN